MKKNILFSTLFMALLLQPLSALSQDEQDSLSTEMDAVQVTAIRNPKGLGLENKDIMDRTELFRAACCNLGESFVNNASVDVDYSDAATGVAQIKLLGLSGTYVQMMTENIPNFRGAAMPYALGFVPGPWMQSVQVSKGASSVKNGYESMTGQVNVEFLKPQGPEQLNVNAYLNQRLRYEVNMDGFKHFRDYRWSTGLLAHYEDGKECQDHNGDSFIDEPMPRQLSLMNRWAFVSSRYIMQAQIKGLWKDLKGGQKPGSDYLAPGRYGINVRTDRYELHLKNAYIINPDRNANVALILSGNIHNQDALYGNRTFDIRQRNLYASLMFEEDFTEHHSLSTGLSLQHDQADCTYSVQPWKEARETVPGLYAQYTYNHGDLLTLQGGIRADYSNLWGTFVTPRAHFRLKPAEWFTMRASAGKGYRTARVMLENNYLLASSRKVTIEGSLPQEESWNCGTSLLFTFPLGGRSASFNVDYYYTDFQHQVIMNRDRDAHKIIFQPLRGRSFSHCMQTELNLPLPAGLNVMAAWRLNYVRATIDGKLRELPLNSRYKGLLSIGWKSSLELWQADVTCQLNGPGRMPDPYVTESGSLSWEREYKAFPMLSAQITRFFRHWSVYVGAENITGFRQHHPIVDAGNPWGDNFDATMVWGPVEGAKVYAGVRFNLTKY